MARPLTKTNKKDGTPYTRPPEVEAHIDEIIPLGLAEIRARALIADPHDPRYLKSECLVYLIREGLRQHRRSQDQRLLNAIMTPLLNRCEVILLSKLPDCHLDALDLCAEILRRLVDLFLQDGLGRCPDKLDIYEVRFNLAFRALRVDVLRREQRKRERGMCEVPLPEEAGGWDAEDEALNRLPEELKVLPTQEADALRAALIQATWALPPDERDAVALVYLLGYKEESDDPAEMTAAKRCGVSGRTIRNRLQRAIVRLRHLLKTKKGD